MYLMYLLDTNAISETRRPERMNPAFKAWLAGKGLYVFYTSAVVIMELERDVLGMARIQGGFSR